MVPPPAPSAYTLPTDPTERLPVALQHLEGWVEAVLALLRYAPSHLSACSERIMMLTIQIPHIATCPRSCSSGCRRRSEVSEPHSRYACTYLPYRVHINIMLIRQTLPYISPQHRASLVASLPRIWTAGLQLLASIANRYTTLPVDSCWINS